MKLIDELLKRITELNRLQSSFLDDSLRVAEPVDIEGLNAYLGYCIAKGISIDFLAHSYDLIVKDTFKEQVYFQRHKKYRNSTYADVAKSVYQSEEYMTKYMYGLALSAFLWPNHRELHHFFLDHIVNDKTGEYLEIGPGHGFYFMQSMKKGNFSKYKGIDISPTSVALTTDIISSQYFGCFTNYEIECADFLSSKISGHYDFIVMSEVLEHVEQPQLFLARINQLLAESGTAFITTCINSPAIDHIYLYQSVEELVEQVEGAGLKVDSQLVVPYSNLTLEHSMERLLPVNIAMTLRKQ
jgi:2-polyprenyl-3-methyl-5-hydroxy-6-metoxy-1,4-benzoquinol methylase